ncbi:glycosyltransferase family 4 protein [Butyricimonas hominis]|uniref:glycosyltransferase family 4 protein n=1 Tax=Butyricimonas TaxID=574697 RepID=UPI003514B9BE
MQNKVIYVTSACPYGKGEVWGIREIISLKEAGVEVVVVPRSLKGKQIVYRDAHKILNDILAVSLLDPKAICYFLGRCFSTPVSVFKTLKWIVGYADSFTWLVKALVVTPKSYFVARRLRGKEISHIHAFSSTSVSVVAYILSTELHVPWSITFHSSWKIDDKYKSISTQLASVKFVRAISTEVQNTLDCFTSYRFSDKLKVVHIGVDCETLGNKQIECNRGIFRICTVGGLNSWKGIDISLQAIKELIDRGKDHFQWFFYGDGPLKESLMEMSIRLNIEKYAVFAGSIDNASIISSYQNGDIDLYVQNSICRDGVYEGIPVSIMEAMANGIPVIASDCGGTKELVDSESGTLIEQGNPIMTAEEIIRYMGDHEYRRRQRERALGKVKKEFNSRIIANELIQLFK